MPPFPPSPRSSGTPSGTNSGTASARSGRVAIWAVAVGASIVGFLIWTLQRPETVVPIRPAERSWLVAGAEVLMPKGGQLTAVKGMAVFGRGQVIAAIAPLTDLTDLPADVQRIDGAGATLLPGLMDAWCHVKDPTDLDHALAAGVTTLRVMDSPSWLPRALEQRRDLGIPSPRCITFGRDLRRHVARTPDKKSLRGEELRKVIEGDVEAQARAGVAGFTLGHDASREVLRLVLDATSRYRLPLSIRTPGRTSFRRVAFEGDSIGSLETFLGAWLTVARRQREPKPPPSAETLAGNVAMAIDSRRTVLTGLVEFATAARLLETEPHFLAEDFVRNRYDQVDEGRLMAKAEDLAKLPPLTRVTWSQAAHQLRRNLPASALPNLLAALPLLDQIVLQLDEAGAQIVVATGAGAPHVLVGRSVIDELVLLHGAGVSAEKALTAATSSAANFLGTPQAGVVAVGRVADLVLVEGRPLDDLESLRRVRSVARAGLWNHREAIEERQATDRTQLDLEIDFIVTASLKSIRGPAEESARRLDLLVKKRGITVRRETVESLQAIFRTADVFRPDHAAVLDEFLRKYFD